MAPDHRQRKKGQAVRLEGQHCVGRKDIFLCTLWTFEETEVLLSLFKDNDSKLASTVLTMHIKWVV